MAETITILSSNPPVKNKIQLKKNSRVEAGKILPDTGITGEGTIQARGGDKKR